MQSEGFDILTSLVVYTLYIYVWEDTDYLVCRQSHAILF